jgi:hypothetical protein
MGNETITEKAAMPDRFELGELNFALRGRLLRDSFGESVSRREDAAGDRTGDRRWPLRPFGR